MSSIRQAAKGLLGGPGEQTSALEAQVADLEHRVAVLAEGLEESRRLNERLCDVLDLVTELLLPAVDRDDERLKASLDKLGTVI